MFETVPVLAGARQARIVEEVRRAGDLRVADLTDMLGVSDMTVRRDLDVLARRGLLAKVHGGATAVPARADGFEPAFRDKLHRRRAEKDAIGARAAALVQPGTAIALTAGTTCWAVAQHLGGIADLTVVTNSLKVAETLHQSARPDLTVVLAGGIRTPSDGLVGPVTVQAVRSLRVDLVIMGAHGLDADAGMTTPNLLEADTHRAFLASAKRLVVVADSTKWGVIGLARVTVLADIATLVTDAGLDADAAAVLDREVGEVLVARPPSVAAAGAVTR